MWNSITFDQAENKIVLNMDDEPIKEYTKDQAQQYVIDTGREADVVAMGWTA